MCPAERDRRLLAPGSAGPPGFPMGGIEEPLWLA